MLAKRRLNLPPVYELVTLLPGGRVLEHALQLAADGAEEGTLIWAPPPVAAGGSSIWPGELDCALILRPEDSVTDVMQLVYLAGLSLVMAISEQAPPITRVRLRWPNTVQLNHCQAAVVTPKWALNDDGRLAWLVLAVSADMAADRREHEMPEHDEDRNYAVPELLERFCRHFLSRVNRWTDEGFEPARTAWLRRADGVDEPIEIEAGPKRVRGVFETVNEAGELVLRLADNSRRQVSIAEALA